MLSAEVLIPVHGDWVGFQAFMCNLGTLEGFATDPVVAVIEITCGSHLIMKNINGTVCLRDDNPTELPLVEEDWFQAADESAHPIVPGHGQAMVRATRVSQIDGHSSIEEPLTPSDDPSEPTQMDPPGGPDPVQVTPFTLAKARATQSHMKAVVSSVEGAPTVTVRHPVSQVADN